MRKSGCDGEWPTGKMLETLGAFYRPAYVYHVRSKEFVWKNLPEE